MKYSRLKQSEVTLFETEYLALVETDDNSYTFCKEVQTQNSTKVAVLPYKIESDGYYFLSVVERYHPYNEAAPVAITGKIDLMGSSDPYLTAVKELKEEAGYIPCGYNEVDHLIYLGSVHPSKSMDTLFECYAIDIAFAHKVEATGDGTIEEEIAYTQWIHESAVETVICPIFISMVYKVKNTL